MTGKALIRRYIVFVAGLFISSLGVSLVTKASLGTSPISSIPYVLSLIFPMSLGQFTIWFSILLIVLQILILGRSFKKSGLLQIPVSILFGYFIDWTMLLLAEFDPSNYMVQLLSLLLGCIILALGVYLEVIANVIMLPGESFVKAITVRFHTDFGITKVGFDVSVSVIAGVISFAILHEIIGVREGTVIAALIVGLIARFMGRKLGRLTAILIPAREEAREKEDIPQSERIVITIGREYGSGGREIGKLLADRLGIAYYDKELIKLAVNASGYSEEYIEENEQKLTNSFFFDLCAQYYLNADDEQSRYEKLFSVERDIIKDTARKQSCVIVGRMANVILKNVPNSIHIFVGADLKSKIRHVVERDGLNETAAEEKILKVDAQRRRHCKYFTGTDWGSCANYDLTFRSDKIDSENIVEIVSYLAESMLAK